MVVANKQLMFLNAYRCEYVIFAVYFYNFGMPDFGVSSLAGIIDMVKVLAFTVKEGRVAVHCHAGLGRTGRNNHTYCFYCSCKQYMHVSMCTCYALRYIQCVPVCVCCVLRCPDRLLLDLHSAHQPK